MLSDRAPELYHILGSMDPVRRNGRKRGDRKGGRKRSEEGNKEAKPAAVAIRVKINLLSQ